MTKEEFKAAVLALMRYEPEYDAPVESDCPCCYSSGGVRMVPTSSGDYLDYWEIYALLNKL